MSEKLNQLKEYLLSHLFEILSACASFFGTLAAGGTDGRKRAGVYRDPPGEKRAGF